MIGFNESLYYQAQFVLIMFTQFLHPELVLFGEFSTGKIKCSHEHETKDGEIIVHQVINRAVFLQKSLINTFTKMLQQMERQKDQNGQSPQLPYEAMDRFHGRDYHNQECYSEPSDGQDYNQQNIGFQGYFEQDPNPYADQVYGLNMDAQYMPQQLNDLGQPSPKKTRPNQVKGLPFLLKKKETLKKSTEKEENEDEQGWITEQEQQYYVNEQLQEAGGNFATQFESNSIE